MISLSCGQTQEMNQTPARLEIQIADLLAQDYDPHTRTYGCWEIQINGINLRERTNPITEKEIQAMREDFNPAHYVIPNDRLCVADYDSNDMCICLTIGWPRTRGESDDNDREDLFDLPLVPRELTTLSELAGC